MLVDGAESQHLEPDIHVRMAHVYCGGEQFIARATSAHGFLFVLNGQGTLLINDHELPMKQAQCVYYRPGMSLRWNAEKVTLCRYTIKGSRAAALLATAGISPAEILAVNQPLYALITKTMYEIQNQDRSFSRHFPILFAWELINGLSQCQAPITDQAEAIKDLIDEQFHNAVHINELAQRIGVNRSTLFRQFKKRYAVSPKAYLDDCRFAYALQLLATSTMNIEQIAYNCGFTDTDHFSRRFKLRYQMSPSAYRAEQT